MATYVKTISEILSVWNGTDAYEPLVCLTSHGLSESVDEVSTRTKCDANGATQKRAGAYSYEISFDGVYPEVESNKIGYVGLKSKLRALGNVDWKITTTYSDASSDVEYGNGYFSNLEKTAEIDTDITFTGSLMGSGLISDTDPNA